MIKSIVAFFIYTAVVSLMQNNFYFAEATGSNLFEALIFSGFFFPIRKFTAMIILHSHLQPQFKHELFHIYFTK